MDLDRIEWMNTYNVITQYINDVRDLYMNKLQQPDINGWNRIATGNLINSVKTVINIDGSTIEAALQLDECWKFIEFGSQPEGEFKQHWPPVDAIKNWIKIKPVLPRPDKNGKLPTTDQLAFLIGRKIYEKGTTPYRYLQQSIDEVNKYYEQEIENAIALDLAGMVDNVFKYFK